MSQSTFVVARLNAHIEPFARGEDIEDPLDAALREAGVGAVVGGGTELGPDGGIAFADIDIELIDLERGLAIAAQVLGDLGAPTGSYFQYRHDGQLRQVPFGTAECTTLFIDGVGLPAAVYTSSDINDLAAQIEARLDGGALGAFRGSWAGETETAITIIGPSAAAIADAIMPVLRAFPLCQNARLVVRDRHPAGPLREERLPLWGASGHP